MQNTLLITPSPIKKMLTESTSLNISNVTSKKFENKLKEIEKQVFELNSFNLTKYEETDLKPRQLDVTTIENKKISETDTKSSSNKYLCFPKEFKQMCIEKCKTESIKEVSKLYDIPIKNLRRWILVGVDNRKNCGRKTEDPEMESELVEWCKTTKTTNTTKIRYKALELSKNSSFKASNGWFDKFKKKHSYLFCK